MLLKKALRGNFLEVRFSSLSSRTFSCFVSDFSDPQAGVRFLVASSSCPSPSPTRHPTVMEEARLVAKVFYGRGSLEETKKYAASKGTNFMRLWALDAVVASGRVVKKYFTMSTAGLLRFMAAQPSTATTSFYEVINPENPARFYVDVEVDRAPHCDEKDVRLAILKEMDSGLLPPNDKEDFLVNTYVDTYVAALASEWTEDRCQRFLAVLEDAIDAFKGTLNEDVRPLLDRNARVVLTGCKPEKFSVHIVFPDLVMDRNYLGCKMLAYELSRFLYLRVRIRIVRRFAQGRPVDTELLLACAWNRTLDSNGHYKGKNDTAIDEVVYKKNNLMRCMGQSKIGKNFLKVAERDEAGRCVGLLQEALEGGANYTAEIGLVAFQRSLIAISGDCDEGHQERRGFLL